MSRWLKYMLFILIEIGLFISVMCIGFYLGGEKNIPLIFGLIAYFYIIFFVGLGLVFVEQKMLYKFKDK